MLERLPTWLARQDDLFTLMGMDDRMLADMGLSREAIRRRVRADNADGGSHFLPSCPAFSSAGSQCRPGQA